MRAYTAVLLLTAYFGLAEANGAIYLSRWARWGDWSKCSTTCGDGSRVRSRSCHVRYCSGSATQRMSCSKGRCPEWGPWTTSRNCSRTCGGGYMERTRICQTHLPGAYCRGPSYQQGRCAINQCPMWTRWSSWMNCVPSCAGEDVPRPPSGPDGPVLSVSYRERNCNYGSTCPGRSREFETGPVGPPGK